MATLVCHKRYRQNEARVVASGCLGMDMGDPILAVVGWGIQNRALLVDCFVHDRCDVTDKIHSPTELGGM